MLSEEVARYEMLTGESAKDVPISRLGGFLDGFDKAEEVHKQAIEKQIPKKPEMQTDSNTDKDFYVCPTCGGVIGRLSDCEDEHYRQAYCAGCGQAIEWDVESR